MSGKFAEVRWSFLSTAILPINSEIGVRSCLRRRLFYFDHLSLKERRSGPRNPSPGGPPGGPLDLSLWERGMGGERAL